MSSIVTTNTKAKPLFSYFRNLQKSFNLIIYIRFRCERVELYYYPFDSTYEDELIIAIRKKGKKEYISAVGKEIHTLSRDDTSVVRTPFSPFLLEPDNFNLGEKVVRYFLQKGMPFRGALIAPKVIIHPNKSYVSEMEEQAYRELALSAGAREVVVYVGDTLKPEMLENIMKKAL